MRLSSIVRDKENWRAPCFSLCFWKVGWSSELIVPMCSMPVTVIANLNKALQYYYLSEAVTMPYIIYARGVVGKFNQFMEELLSELARKGVHISDRMPIEGGLSMSVKYTDEKGDMAITRYQSDIQVSYSASGGPETLKGALTGAASGGGLGVISGVLTGRSDKDKITAGIAGAITGGAIGTYRGHEKGVREKITFAKLLAATVTQVERKMLTMERMEIAAQSRTKAEKERMLMEKTRLESQIQRLQGELESLESEEESKRTDAEARLLEATARHEQRYPDNKEMLDKMTAMEKKKYEGELKRIESIYGRRRAYISPRITEMEARIKLLDSKIEQSPS